MKPRIVISGVNLVEAGPLSVFQDALDALATHYSEHYEIFALVHSVRLFSNPSIKFLEFPHVKSSWLRRVKFEYWDCRSVSKRLGPYLWLAMHDMTPNVTAHILATYCHNPSPFYKLRFREAMVGIKFTLFTLFYKFLYRINIHRNRFVVVQQDWIRQEFRGRYGVDQVIVAHPSIPHLNLSTPMAQSDSDSSTTRFIYPAFPRSFKNIEVILGACRLLEQGGRKDFQVCLTLDGHENKYARSLLRRGEGLQSVRWLGWQTRDQIYQLYGEADCLLFPSRLETWGMPLSEFRQTLKPIIAADLPYAHETVGDYGACKFFPATDCSKLAQIMTEVIERTSIFAPVQARQIDAPFASDWQQLFQILLADPSHPTAL